MHATIIFISFGGLKTFKIPPLDIKLISLILRTDQLHILHPFKKEFSFGVFFVIFEKKKIPPYFLHLHFFKDNIVPDVIKKM